MPAATAPTASRRAHRQPPSSDRQAEPTIRDLTAGYPARPVFRCVLAHLHAQLGRATEAMQALRALAQHDCSALPFDQEWLYGTSLLAETSAHLSDATTAEILYRLLEPWAALNAADHPEAMRGSVSRYLGLLAATLGRPDAAARHYEDALAMNTRMGARPWLALSQEDYARLLLNRDRPELREHAWQLLNAALTTFDALDMNAHAARTTALVQQLKAA
jgi:tetratricopeptide (TPR) repeat protein